MRFISTLDMTTIEAVTVDSSNHCMSFFPFLLFFGFVPLWLPLTLRKALTFLISHRISYQIMIQAAEVDLIL